MSANQDTSDEDAIRSLIGAHFEAMRWTPLTALDWQTFSADFLPEALLFPAARPVQVRTLQSFIERMNEVARKSLHTFEEHTRGMQILLFGNVAVVLAASEMLENESEINHDVSGYLLVKSEGKWRIAAHAWDKATNQMPVPPYLR